MTPPEIAVTVKEMVKTKKLKKEEVEEKPKKEVEEKPEIVESAEGELVKAVKKARKEETEEAKGTVEPETKAEAETEEDSPKDESIKDEPAKEESAEEEKTEEEPAEEEPAEEELVKPEITVQSQGRDFKKYFIIGLVVIIVLAVIGGGIYVAQKAMKGKEAPAAPSTTPTPAPVEETETPAESELKREDLKLQVLNGSGVPGRAGEAKDFLEGLGYSGIEVGNADSYDYEETEVSFKEDKQDYLELLTDDLAEEYKLATETGILEEESDFDAVVIIGKE